MKTTHNFDPKSLAESAQRYGRLLRRMRLLYLVSFVPFVVIMILAHVGTQASFALAGAIFVFQIPCFLICGIFGFITDFDLRGFRCPQCEKRFMLSRWSNWPGWRCKHCRFDLKPWTIDAKKPVSTADLLE